MVATQRQSPPNKKKEISKNAGTEKGVYVKRCVLRFLQTRATNRQSTFPLCKCFRGKTWSLRRRQLRRQFRDGECGTVFRSSRQFILPVKTTRRPPECWIWARPLCRAPHHSGECTLIWSVVVLIDFLFFWSIRIRSVSIR